MTPIVPANYRQGSTCTANPLKSNGTGVASTAWDQQSRHPQVNNQKNSYCFSIKIGFSCVSPCTTVYSNGAWTSATMTSHPIATSAKHERLLLFTSSIVVRQEPQRTCPQGWDCRAARYESDRETVPQQKGKKRSTCRILKNSRHRYAASCRQNPHGWGLQ